MDRENRDLSLGDGSPTEATPCEQDKKAKPIPVPLPAVRKRQNLQQHPGYILWIFRESVSFSLLLAITCVTLQRNNPLCSTSWLQFPQSCPAGSKTVGQNSKSVRQTAAGLHVWLTTSVKTCRNSWTATAFTLSSIVQKSWQQAATMRTLRWGHDISVKTVLLNKAEQAPADTKQLLGKVSNK